MKGIIIYKSNYGSTKQYAHWISEDTGFECREIDSIKNKELIAYDTVILGSPIFAGKPLISKWINKRWELLKDKKVALFTTSGADGDDPQNQKGFEGSFSKVIRESVQYFPQGGRMVHADLTGMHKFFMNLGKKMEKDPEVRKEMDLDKDHVKREGIEPILEYVR